jgi:endoglucanase
MFREIETKSAGSKTTRPAQLRLIDLAGNRCRTDAIALALALSASTPLVLGVSACSSPQAGSQNNATPVRTVVLSQAAARARKGVPAPAMPGKNVPAIKVDTVGYEASWRKIAIFNVEPKNAAVKDAKTGKTVLTIAGKHVEARGLDEASRDQAWQVDFSELRTPGRYKLACDGGESDAFDIGEHLYGNAIVAGLKSFYFQRTRTALVEPYAVWEGKAYTRKKPSHVHEDVGWDLLDHPNKKRKWKLEGGWFDAGNFDMYIPSTAVAAETLLLAYEWSPDRFADKQLNIPESGNGIPDLLDETKWGLVWILSLQEPGGGFRARESVIDTSPEGPADEDKTVRWVSGVSSAATAKAISVLAMASRSYEKWDKPFAARCAAAAKSGWAWLEKNPKHVRAGLIGGGAQPLWDDEPENNDTGARFAAAVEMWRTFRDKAALKQAERLLAKAEETQPEKFLAGDWSNISRFGMGTLATDEQTPAGVRNDAKKRILAAAALVRAQVEKKDGYRCATTVPEYYWGSNSNLMEKVYLLALAARLAPTQTWIAEAARDQWHWILGRNPNGYSMVTRVGKGPDRFYHLEWGPMEPPPPGFLVDGPNAKSLGFLAPDAPAKVLLWDNPKPLRSGLPPHSLWHWRQSDLWDGGFVPEGEWVDGWWAVTECDILYSSNFVLAGTTIVP